MSIVEKWRSVLSAAAVPGSWFCSGSVKSPVALVNSHPVALPIKAVTFEHLQALAQKAPFGTEHATIIDETVRKGLQIEPDLVTLEYNVDWINSLRAITEDLKAVYQRKDITLHFYKMLLYEEGGHFAPHKDTLRDKTHIASLLISLPVVGGCKGGVLRVNGPAASTDVMTWDAHSTKESCSWCSFYTDCLHELTPITKGRRVVLAYQVFSDNKVKKPTAVINPEHTSLTDVTDSALSQKDSVMILMKHLYASGCEANHVKGQDRLLFEIMNQHYRKGYEVSVIGLKLMVECEFDYDEPRNDVTLMVDQPFSCPESTARTLASSLGEFSALRTYCSDLFVISKKKLHATDKVHFIPVVKGAKKAKKRKLEEKEDHSPWLNELASVSEEDYNTEKKLHSMYFTSPDCVYLFSTDDFETRAAFYRKKGGYTGNEMAPDLLRYKFYGLMVCKVKTDATLDENGKPQVMTVYYG